MKILNLNIAICFVILAVIIIPPKLISQVKRTEGAPCKFTVRVDTGIIYHDGSDPLVSGTTVNLCPGNNITFTLNQSGANCTCNAPQWKKNGLAIPNATTFIISVTDTGTYSADIACSPWGYTVINIGPIANVKCLITGIVSNSFVADNFLLYPNPVTSVLKINGLRTENTVFNIISATGENVLSGSLTNQQQVDFSNLSDGIYFIVLRNEESIFTQKVIKIANR
jgi:hypothetical protein